MLMHALVADHYWYGIHAFDADNLIITGFIDGVVSVLNMLMRLAKQSTWCV